MNEKNRVLGRSVPSHKSADARPTHKRCIWQEGSTFVECPFSLIAARISFAATINQQRSAAKQTSSSRAPLLHMQLGIGSFKVPGQASHARAEPLSSSSLRHIRALEAAAVPPTRIHNTSHANYKTIKHLLFSLELAEGWAASQSDWFDTHPSS